MIFFPIGLLIGGIGTLIGAGGGFILIPILIFEFPNMTASKIAACSMLAVGANAISGSIAYAIKKKIHWTSALIFTLSALPGIYLGILLNDRVDRAFFVSLFGAMMVVLALYIFWKSIKNNLSPTLDAHQFALDKHKTILGSAISIFIGVLSSFLGIGGGIIHVPLLSTVLKFPVHLAAGTSHLILALTSTFAIAEHWHRGNYQQLESFVLYLLAGIVLGAQLGAAASKHVPSNIILKIMSLALFLGGLRLLVA